MIGPSQPETKEKQLYLQCKLCSKIFRHDKAVRHLREDHGLKAKPANKALTNHFIPSAADQKSASAADVAKENPLSSGEPDKTTKITGGKKRIEDCIASYKKDMPSKQASCLAVRQ